MPKFLSYRTTTHDEEYVNLEDISAIVGSDEAGQSEIWLRSDTVNCLIAVGRPSDVMHGHILDV